MGSAPNPARPERQSGAHRRRSSRLLISPLPATTGFNTKNLLAMGAGLPARCLLPCHTAPEQIASYGRAFGELCARRLRVLALYVIQKLRISYRSGISKA